MSDKLVSVIIPVYNCEKYIKKCLESALGQTYANTDISVIDDGSTDRSLDIIYQTTQEKSNVKVIHQDNQGVSAARNRGLKIVAGEYIAF